MSLVTLPERADVVVVGGGIMGTSAAYFLTTETDLDVLLVEKDKIASGSTGDSSAILRHHYGPKEIYAKTAWWSHRFYREFQERTGEAIAHADSPLVRFGVEGTPEGEYADAGGDVLSSLDVPVTKYDADEFDEQYPMLDLEGVDFAVSDDAAGYSDGTDAAGGFARAAQDAGATVVTGVAVEDFVVEDDAVVGVETNDGAVAAETVVVAAGPWTPRLMARLGVDVPIERTREQVLVLDPPEGFAEEYPDLVPTTGAPGGDWYMRSDFGDGVLVATHHTDETVNPDRYDGSPDQETTLQLLDELEGFAPELAESRVKGQYCGVYSTTPDHDFIVDQVGPDGCFVACGFSGHGFKHGPAVGRILTDLVTEGDTEFVDVDHFSLDRFEDGAAGHGGPGDKI
ncbi:NAD(P)/FAD-dependent oxidoreductase [Halomicrococcus gelatinilyticus]|uniref:NAD(P)/FAD-dependent oxidoreductase n=1 Tax=Halomicrococcus gelatinilyticus TaxID=1702103 RepID=UPI002E10BF32